MVYYSGNGDRPESIPMTVSRDPGMAADTLILCASDDAPAMRAVAQRLKADGLAVTLAVDLPPEWRDSPHALRAVFSAASAVVVCLSHRSWSEGHPVPSLAKLLDALAVTPAPRRPLFALKLSAIEVPPALREAHALELFSASDYERLLQTLRASVKQTAQAPVPVAPRSVTASPALALRGAFESPALARQGQILRFGRGVARAVFMPDQGHVLIVSGGGPALVSLEQGAPLWAIDCPTHCAALGPGGRLLALSMGSRILLWDLARSELLGTCNGHDDRVTAIAFAPDGQTLASTSLDGTVRLWRCAGHGHPVALALLRDGNDPLLSVAFSPDGTLIASGGADRAVRIWRAFDRVRLQTLKGHGGGVEALAFSPDGAMLAAGSRGRVARMWSTRAWQALHVLEDHEGAVESLAFSPDGATLATGAADHQVRLWDARDGNRLRTLQGHSGPIVGVAFGPDGATLATVAEDERLIAWRVADGAPVTNLRALGTRATALAVGPCGERLAVGTSDGSLAVYHLEGSGVPRTRLSDHQGAISGVVFSGPQRLFTIASDRRIRSYQLDTGDSSTLFQTNAAHTVAAFAPGGQVLALSNSQDTVQLWRLDLSSPAHPGGHFWRVLRGLRARPRQVAFGEGVMAIAAEDGYVYLWRLADLERETDQVSLRLPGGAGPTRSLSLSDDGTLIGLGDEQGVARILRASDGTLLWTLTGASGALVCLAFGPDGRSLAAGNEHGAICVWRLGPDTRQRANARVVITGHAGAVTHLAYASGGRALVSASSDGTVRVWRV
ncbi:MAG: hypothetical protein SNJ69_08725 [Chloroflexaceae bacterium]